MTWDGVWEDPPVHPREVWQARLEPLTGEPGRWAKFGPFAHGTHRTVKKINDGDYGPGYEARRSTRAGSDWVYARFVAKPDLRAVGQ